MTARTPVMVVCLLACMIGVAIGTADVWWGWSFGSWFIGV